MRPYFMFTIYLTGYGKTQEEAWKDVQDKVAEEGLGEAPDEFEEGEDEDDD